MEFVGPLVFFAFISTITPGPNNITLMSSGVNYGISRSLPFFTGIQVGFFLMVISLGLGASFLLQAQYFVSSFIKLVGVCYLLYLAWKIGHAAPQQFKVGNQTPLSFIQALLLQWLNPKAWSMITGAIAAFTSPQEAYWEQIITIAIVFLLVGIPCTLIWLVFGNSLQRLLKVPLYRRRFNYSMAGLLVLSVLAPLWESLTFIHDLVRELH